MKNYFQKRLLWSVYLSFVLAVPLKAQHSNMAHHAMATNNQEYLRMMDTMMIRMDAVSKSLPPGSGFLLQMIPHHQTAIDMARFEMAHGRNAEMIQLAKSILAEQTTEITRMNLLVQTAAPGSTDTAFNQLIQQVMEVMMHGMEGMQLSEDTDRAFAAVMLEHHKAAVGMAQALLRAEASGSVASFAILLIADEQVEIDQMLTFLK